MQALTVSWSEPVRNRGKYLVFSGGYGAQMGATDKKRNTMLLRSFIVLCTATLGACGGNTSGIPPLADERYELDVGGNCVLDTSTGLLWERKRKKPGLRNWNNSYTWFDPDAEAGEIDYRGTRNGGSCEESDCDTWHFVAAFNRAGYCGHNDWRVPTRDELYSISDLSKAESPPTTNEFAYPLTHAAEYWSENDYSFQPDSAWAWNFQYGHDRVDWKKTPKFVRLVRGAGSGLEQVKE